MSASLVREACWAGQDRARGGDDRAPRLWETPGHRSRERSQGTRATTVLTEIKNRDVENRDVEDVCIVVCDGLKRLPESRSLHPRNSRRCRPASST